VTDGKHLMLADDPVGFSRAVVRLLRDRNQREQIGSAARALVVEQYDWSTVAGALEDALKRIALGRAQSERGVPLTARAAPVAARASGRSS